MSEVWDVENEDGDGEVGGGMLRRGWMDGWCWAWGRDFPYSRCVGCG